MTSPASLKTPYLEDNAERTLTNSSTEADIRAIAFSVIGSAIGGVVGLIDDGKYGSIRWWRCYRWCIRPCYQFDIRSISSNHEYSYDSSIC